MNEPTFADGPPMPLMVEGLIDATMLRQLFSDLASAATVTDVREKGGPRGYALPTELTPDLARDRLLSGLTRAVQVRYRFDSHEWTDTIVRMPTGYRVVRCRHDS
ncbi:MAG: hypothetical protein C0467_29125 [Planctomycetaceae bacterium]|nr:hypothetical protein [Planctomycetaceae bacterium]